jgi:amino acid adenylation domain-containing protein
MKPLLIETLNGSLRNSPDAIAAIFQGTQLSYAELDRLSDHIGAGLLERGVGPGEKIGLYLEKSIDALASIYAVLKAGACYVPMSPADPASRTGYLLNNCNARLMLCSGPLKPELDAILKTANVAKIDVKDLLADQRISAREFHARPASSPDAAAVLHTSGSTGDPKGAVITHGNLAAFLAWSLEAFALNSNDRLLSHAPLQFDLSFFDLFSALAAGATVVLAEPSDTANAVRMARLVNETGVTVWQSVPSALTLQTVSGRGEAMPGVRHVLFAGEPMPRQTLLKLPELFPNARLHNVYGCTESNDTFMYTLPENVHEAPDPLPIGWVLPHIRYRIVDPSGQDVAPGEQGHLLVSGDTVMAGYLGISNSGRIAGGYYRTNDLVSQDDDGLLHFHGRIDSVIKTNGYRVNLTEIEDYLQRSGQFSEVALFCVPDDSIGQRIVATVRPAAGVRCSTLDLKIYCAHGLPKYAIPHSFHITTHELPKGTTGKIDRRRISDLWRQECAARKTNQQGESHHERS